MSAAANAAAAAEEGVPPEQAGRLRKLLVLGGTGSTGRWFVEHALDHGHSVRVVTRNPDGVTKDKFRWASHPNLDLVKCDVSAVHMPVYAPVWSGLSLESAATCGLRLPAAVGR